MRFERTDSFRADHRRLTDDEKQLVRAAIVEFAAACDRFISDATPFPAHLRVKPVKGARGVFEMTWSFASPDGRATWEWIELEIEGPAGSRTIVPAVRWRRLGGHEVFRSP